MIVSRHGWLWAHPDLHPGRPAAEDKPLARILRSERSDDAAAFRAMFENARYVDRRQKDPEMTRFSAAKRQALCRAEAVFSDGHAGQAREPGLGVVEREQCASARRGGRGYEIGTFARAFLRPRRGEDLAVLLCHRLIDRQWLERFAHSCKSCLADRVRVRIGSQPHRRRGARRS